MYREGALSSVDRPLRTCIGCRRRHQQRHLVRFAVTGVAIVVDTGQVLPGRGAYLCWRRGCAERVLGDGRPLGRALRTRRDSVTVDTGALLQDWEANRRPPSPTNGNQRSVEGTERRAVRPTVRVASGDNT